MVQAYCICDHCCFEGRRASRVQSNVIAQRRDVHITKLRYLYTIFKFSFPCVAPRHTCNVGSSLQKDANVPRFLCRRFLIQEHDDVHIPSIHPHQPLSLAPSLDTELQHLVHAPYDTPVLEALHAFTPASPPPPPFHAATPQSQTPVPAWAQDLPNDDVRHVDREELLDRNQRQHAQHVVDGVSDLVLSSPAFTARRVDGVARLPTKPRHVLLRDKFAFVLGSSCLW